MLYSTHCRFEGYAEKTCYSSLISPRRTIVSRLWLFDNDGTLYDDVHVGSYFAKLLHDYTVEVLAIDSDEVDATLSKWKTRHNTEFTIIAIMRERHISFVEIVEAIYLRLPLNEIILHVRDVDRLEFIRSLEGKKTVFTNNPSSYAVNLLIYLGFIDAFSQIIGMEELGFILKPDIRAYRKVATDIGIHDEIIFVDDRLENLLPALEVGWIPVWYTSDMHMEIPKGIIRINKMKQLGEI